MTAAPRRARNMSAVSIDPFPGNKQLPEALRLPGAVRLIRRRAAPTRHIPPRNWQN